MAAASFDERAGELAACTEVLERAILGDGQALVIEGEPGIGKTTLLDEVRRMAEARGARVLRARGRPLDTETAYSLARELLMPLAVVDRATVLSGAAARAAAFLDGEVPEGVEPFVLRHALSWLLANVTELGPLVVLVDDLHWADAASVAWLESLASDVPDLPVALFVTTRPGHDGAGSSARLAARARLVRVAALGDHTVTKVVSSAVANPSAAFVSACKRASGANPLLLRELVDEAVRRGLDPTSSDASAIDTLVPDGVASAVRGRLDALDVGRRELAEVAALAGDGARLRHVAVAAELSVLEAADRIGGLLGDRILTSVDPVVFAHPLVQRAVADQVSPGRRGRTHLRLARAYADEGDTERACAHLVAAPPARDPEVVDLLVAQAATEAGRGSPATAAHYLRRALEEPPVDVRRRDVLLALGEAENQLGEASAIEHLAAAHTAATGPAERARSGRPLARALAFHGRVEDAAAVLAALLAEASDAATRAQLRADTFLLVQNLQASVRPGLRVDVEVPDHLPEDVRGPGGAAMTAAIAYERALLWHGTAAQLSALCAGAFGAGLLEEEGMESPSVGWGLQAAMVGGDWVLAETLLDRGEADARRRGSVRGLAAVCALRTRYGVVRGRPDRAELDGRLAVALAREAHPLMLPFALAALVMALSLRGRPEEADRLLDEHGMTGALPPTRLGTTLLLARMMLASAAHRAAEAARDADQLSALTWGNHRAPPLWTPALVDALHLAGRVDEAAGLAQTHVENARSWGAPAFLAEALLTLGRTGASDPIPLATEALRLLEGQDSPLLRATALADLGAELRRRNRRAEARAPLAQARELATACGADLVAERAHLELLAAGGRPRRIQRTGADALTPSERRVAELARDGMSNTEIAQHLYVTRKTVEKHLGNAYAKLQISRRGELRAVLAARSAGAAN